MIPKKIILTFTLVLFATTGFAAKKEKVDICHFDMDYGVWKQISISGNAVEKHFNNHDDGFPDGDTLGTNTPLDDICVEEFCGDGTVQLSEQCDDGNAISGDGCSMECEVEVEVSCPCWTAEVLDSVDGFNTDDDKIGIYTQSNPPHAYCEEWEQATVYTNNYIFYRLEEGLGEPFEVCQSGGSSNPPGSGISLRYYGEADARNGLTLEESLACSAEAQACVDKITQ